MVCAPLRMNIDAQGGCEVDISCLKSQTLSPFTLQTRHLIKISHNIYIIRVYLAFSWIPLVLTSNLTMLNHGFVILCIYYKKEKMAPRRGLEPPTCRLTAECSTIELSRNVFVWPWWATWQRPTLPQGLPCSTIGPVALNLRVRYGNECIRYGIITRLIEGLFLQNCT